MARQKSDKEKAKEAKRRQWFWDLSQTIIGRWIRPEFNLTLEDFEPADIEGPVLVAINHTCAYDPIFTGAAFKNKPLTFIASEHIVRSKPWGPLLDKYVSLIPHQKGGKGSRTALIAMKRIKRGESIFLAVEGEQTWNGQSLPVMPFTGKLVKGSGATLVTYLFEGGYLSDPRWAMEPRRGRVHGRPVRVYAPAELKEMSDEEVEEAIAKDLWFDTWEWQKSQPGGPVRFRSKKGNAEGIERAIFSCPECGSFGTLRSSRDDVSCSCGFKVRLTDTGFFEPAEPFETILEWEKHDRSALTERMKEMLSRQKAGTEDAADSLFADDSATLYHIKDDHEEEEAARGRLTLACKDGEFILSIGEYRFSLAGISNMTMVLAARVVFSDESGYYELRSDKGSKVNLRKYVIARDILKTIDKE